MESVSTPNIVFVPVPTDPYDVLDYFEPICYAMVEGVLFADVKRALEMLSPEEREAYLTWNNTGADLLARICLKGDLREVRYALETLNLHKFGTQRRWMSPLQCAMSSRKPSVEVIKYLI